MAQDGMALQFASERLRADYGVVKARSIARIWKWSSCLVLVSAVAVAAAVVMAWCMAIVESSRNI